MKGLVDLYKEERFTPEMAGLNVYSEESEENVLHEKSFKRRLACRNKKMNA